MRKVFASFASKPAATAWKRMCCIAGLASSINKPDGRHCVGRNDGASHAIQRVHFQTIRRTARRIGVHIETADWIHNLVVSVS